MTRQPIPPLSRRAGKPVPGAGPPPLYQRIEAHLRTLIEAGKGRAEPLPAEPELAAEFGVSRMTVRQAYQRLVSTGAVVRYRGQGSFATGHVVESMPIEGVPDFQSWIVRGETATDRRVLELTLVAAPTDVAKEFGLGRRARVTYVRLIRVRNGVRCVDTRYLPAALHGVLTVARLERASMLQTMRDLGYEVASGRVEIDAHHASEQDARMLGTLPGEPVLERRVAFSDPLGRCIVVGNSRYPGGDAYTFRVDFRQAGAASVEESRPPRHSRRVAG
jgi:GntR family transcriptional regulator